MSRLDDARRFAEVVRKLTSPDDLNRVVEEICREIGFRRFGYGHHYDHNVGITEAFFHHNYPENWSEPFIARNYYLNDPVVRACRGGVPYHWAKLPQILSLTEIEQELMAAAKGEDVRDGFTIPIDDAEGYGASFNFVTPSKKRRLKEGDYLMATLIGRVAFEAARLMHLDETVSVEDDRPRLSQRQRDCLVLAAQGKTDWEISRILGISQETVKLHIRATRERYHANKRMSVVIRALHQGDIDLSEVIH